MEAIATQLGVSKGTVSADLKDIVQPLNNVEDPEDYDRATGDELPSSRAQRS
jgi:hypothetical protein